MSSSAWKYVACTFLMSVPSIAFARQAVWPDTPVSRLEAYAVVQTLNTNLLSHDSATLTLERWCKDHKLADPAKITAERIKDDKSAPQSVREHLKVTSDETLGYRHVRLKCGDIVLSEADNWYVPARLTQDMNETLNTTDTPFGKVVMPLQFQRHTLSAELLWQPLPEGWDSGAKIPSASDKNLEVPHIILRHQAVLTKPDGNPISFVVENYTSDIVNFTPSVISKL